MNTKGQIIPMMFPSYRGGDTSGRFLISALIASNIFIFVVLWFSNDSIILSMAKGMSFLINGFALLILLTIGIEWVLEKVL